MVYPAAERNGIVRVAADPLVNALHRAMLGHPRRLTAEIQAARRAMVDRLVANGPDALEARERRQLLTDPVLLDLLHDRVWSLPDRERALRWGRPAGTRAA